MRKINYLLLYLNSLFNFLPERDIRCGEVGLLLAVGLYLAAARTLVLHAEQRSFYVSLYALSAVRVPASVHHVRALIFEIVLLLAYQTLKVVVQVLYLESLGTLLLIGKIIMV